MEFTIKNINENIAETARKIGYLIIDTKDNGKYNLVRRLAIDNYPRFHAYVKQRGADYIFDLHLDQKRPSYKETHAHSGEYFGPVIDAEAERIRNILKKEDI